MFLHIAVKQIHKTCAAFLIYIFLQIFLTADDAEVRPFIHVCHSKNGVYFSWTLYIVEGIILVFGAFLAWETRNVSSYIKSLALSRNRRLTQCFTHIRGTQK